MPGRDHHESLRGRRGLPHGVFPRNGYRHRLRIDLRKGHPLREAGAERMALAGALRMIETKTDQRQQLALFHRAGFKSNGEAWERRLYRKLYMRMCRRDREFRRKESAGKRRRRKLPGRKAAACARRRAWGARNRRRLRRYNRDYYLQFCARRCAFCRRLAGRGRNRLRVVRGRPACPGCFA